MAYVSEFVKHLTDTDVTDRLEVVRKMADKMPTAAPGPGIPISVLDDQGDVYQFHLVGRTGRPKHPYFKPRDWRRYIRRRGARPGYSLCFWKEANEGRGTEYRIEVNPPFESPTNLTTWARHGLTL